MVALFAAAFGCFSIAPFLPCEHGFAYVNTAVVHNIGLYNLVAVGRYYVGKRVTEQVVAYVSQVEGLVGVGRRVLDHYKRRIFCDGNCAPVLCAVNLFQQANPMAWRYGEVEKSFHYVEFFHYIEFLLQSLANLLSRLFGAFLGE